jgi:hypothetical protein
VFCLLNKSILQPAICVTSLAAVEVLRARDGGEDVINSVDVTCGLSLGEYTALAFAGAFRYSFCSCNQLFRDWNLHWLPLRLGHQEFQSSPMLMHNVGLH